MADVEPSVSTDRRRFTIAPCSASWRVPIDSSIVTTAGNPVGIAAMARVMPVRNSESKSSPRASPRMMMSTRAAAAMIVMITVS